MSNPLVSFTLKLRKYNYFYRDFKTANMQLFGSFLCGGVVHMCCRGWGKRDESAENPEKQINMYLPLCGGLWLGTMKICHQQENQVIALTC